AMTLFAVANAALFPILHLGRPWFFYWLIPYPTAFGVWPQFRSPLVWDFFAIATYALVSIMFWYMGLIPDLATLRDRARSRFGQVVYGFLALGWRNSVAHWHRFERAYLLLAALATPLVVSVHSIVGLDFATSLLPGWHSTMFPPYFVAGAVFSGFAMVLTLAIPLRAVYDLRDLITMHHLDNMAKVMLATGLMVVYGYIMEAFVAWYSGNMFEQYVAINRAFGPYGPFYWLLLFCNGLAIQPLWFRRVRASVPLLFIIALVVNVGMWLERFIIVVTSLHRDFLPSSWDIYIPTWWDWATFLGTFGLFLTLFFLFIRVLPAISIFEMRELVHEEEGEAAAVPAGRAEAELVS
ncbi:MAG TPA: polysulfide reductase NrfD, partial [Anaerolineae bacterium]|nr:polysulfide reductase NrfD [Anaerolineae bacterium]